MEVWRERATDIDLWDIQNMNYYNIYMEFYHDTTCLRRLKDRNYEGEE